MDIDLEIMECFTSVEMVTWWNVSFNFDCVNPAANYQFMRRNILTGVYRS